MHCECTYRHAKRCLSRIAMKCNAIPADKICYVRDILYCPNFIVYSHDRNKEDILIEHIVKRRELDEALSIHWDLPNDEFVLFFKYTS